MCKYCKRGGIRVDKKEVYFVIVNLENLKFEDNGEDVSFIENAEHFDTLEEAKEKIKEYDDDFKGSIYKVSKRCYYDFELQKEEL